MKLAPVLAQYLAIHKTLNLPGIGTFSAENAYDPEIDYGKKGATLLSVNFEQNKVSELDDELISFVAKETGKMKVLSESDIRSQTDGMIDFLNTGKPYFLQGIGTLTRKPDGTYEFHKEKYHHVEKKRESAITEKNSIPQSYIDNSRRPRNNKPAALIMTLVLLAIVAIIWFYVKNSQTDQQKLEDITESALASDTSATAATSPSTTTPKATTPGVPANQYKYILEIMQEPRASKRFNQLKTINWPVQLETRDSVNFTLYMLLPKAGADTTHVKDSLTALSGKTVWIAH
ncbi:hypothetical protein [Niabella terrae]